MVLSSRKGRPFMPHLEGQMDKPRIFLGSSGKQAKLLQALTRRSELPVTSQPAP
jgi:hypothetical protein